MKQNRKKIIMLALSGCMLITSLPTAPIFAQSYKVEKVKPSKQETVYVNLGCKGNIEEIKVLNDYVVNGNTIIEDYGKYEEITNLTNYIKPAITKEKVTWNLSQGANRLLYQGIVKEGELPWKFDITYKLNGAEIAAPELLHQKGLVEIIIDVTRNEKANPYYINNYLLQVGASFDLDKCISVEGIDATEVITGRTKSVAFSLMPGEERTLEVRVGAEDFEMSGLTMGMVPARMPMLQDVKDLKEDKDEIQGVVDAMSDSLDVILDGMSPMQSGFTLLQQSLRDMQKGTTELHHHKAKTDRAIDDFKEQLTKLTDTLQPVKEDLATARRLIDDIYTHANNLNDSSYDFQKSLEDLKEVSTRINETLLDIPELIDDMDECVDDTYDLIESDLDDMEDFSADMERLIESFGGVTSPIPIDGIGNVDSAMRNIESDLVSAQHAIRKHQQNIPDVKKNIVKSLDKMRDFSKDGIVLTDTMVDFADTSIEIIEKVQDFHDALDPYEEEFYTMLDHAEALLDETTNMSTKTTDVISEMQNTLNILDKDIYKGVNGSLEGLISISGEVIKTLAQVDVLRDSKRTIKDKFDEVWDDLEDDYRVLNIDFDAKPVSFVSTKNPAPQSVQFLVRTPDIKEVEDEGVLDLEPEKHKPSMMDRVKQLVQSLVSKIKSIFSKEDDTETTAYREDFKRNQKVDVYTKHLLSI